ncbi:FAD-binding oxidoreductase [Siminovitchia sp. FSL H7-0308]|uniref:Glycolate oxidase FAD binding subunit n=1 Tax=Siminovitchia thermophila TaxID=1245522 RepID=A0ABS2RCQ3_9BACI|nr:FAD-binding oxidoreductase [Siminovitchia thermophila]MBM7716974.1 glycolate oxidase FAD binding subunit [Siminovitchia thermophila]ONK25296.1 FAD-binding oxidoreductase [Bacillus sp. VT-16-64]
MTTASILSHLKAVIPEDRIFDGEDDELHLGNGGKVTIYPKTEQEMADILAYANTSGQTVSVMGAGTKRGFGGLTEQADILISTKSYTGVVEHVQGDMTVTVRAGTVFGELQQYLADYYQKVAVDPFFPEEATVGGVIAANDSGPKRFRYGAARDAVIGMRIVYPDGKIIRTGGKVVKNVAGYDMNKLFIGSMGTLGVISEVTFKLRPLPKCESVAFISFPANQMKEIRRFASQLLDVMIEPVAIELLNPTMAATLTGYACTTLVVSFEDVESSVLYQENMLKAMKPSDSELSILSEGETKQFWDSFYSKGNKGQNVFQAAVKIGVVNMDVVEIINETMKLEHSQNIQLKAHGGLGHGLCKINFYGEAEKVVAAIHQMRTKAEQLGGYAVITHLPLSYRKEIQVWGEKPSYFFLLEGMKKEVDPKGILNRHRFVGGI